MMQNSERAPADWFRAAMDCYVVEHQGCPCCRERHCVFRSFWGKRIEYYCSVCEFSVCLDAATGACYFTAGDRERADAGVLDAVG
jgi:hypothetical protein